MIAPIFKVKQEVQLLAESVKEGGGVGDLRKEVEIVFQESGRVETVGNMISEHH